MEFESLYHVLKKIIRFEDADFDLFSKELTVVHLDKNEVWEEEGRISRNMGFLNKGLVREYCIKDGEEYTTEFHMENDFLGNYISYQTETPSSIISEALEETELYVIPFANFEKFCSILPIAKEAADQVANSKLLKIHDRNSSLLTENPEERYRNLMDKKPELINRVPQYLIAQYLGIRPESLSRIRKRYMK